MPDPPLALSLAPLPVRRAPALGDSVVEYGFALQLPDGSVVLDDDPLLDAFATVISHLNGVSPDQEALQNAAFDPGRLVALVVEGVDDDGDEVVGVWDVEHVHRAGTLPCSLAVRVAAAQEHGLELRAVALAERRTRRDDRRCGLYVVVAPVALVAIDATPADTSARRRRPTRRRLVLVADGRADLRWWDPSAATGPIPLSHVPVSAELGTELAQLGQAYAAAKPAVEEAAHPLQELEHGMRQDALHDRIRAAWTRARAELGRTYAVGLLVPGMDRPAWSPDELPGDADDDNDP